MESVETISEVRGPMKGLLVVAGGFFLGLAWLGFVVPGLPGTPFLLLASTCWIRSSPRLHRWLLDSRWFGPMLRDWRVHRAVRPRVKWLAATTMLVVVTLSITLGGFRGWALALLISLALVGFVVVLRLPVVEDELDGGLEPSA